MKNPSPASLFEQNFNVVLQTIQSVVILIARDGTVVAMNPYAESVSGYRAEEIVNHAHWSVFIPEHEKDEVAKVFDALIAGDSCSLTINHWESKSGELLPIKWNNAFIRDENDDIQFVVATGTEVSDYYESLDEVQLTSSVFEMADPCSITDRNNRILCVNKAFTELTGYRKEEVIGQNPSILSSGLHDKKFYREMWKSLLDTGSWAGEVINRAKDGSLFTEYTRINAVYDVHGNLTNYVSSFIDITALKENEKKLDFLSKYDTQTGLVNRYQYIKLIETELLSLGEQPAALLYLRLKKLNTLKVHYGIQYTDTVLLKFIHQAEKRLEDLVKTFTLARISGSDFAIHFKLTSGAESMQLVTFVEEVIAQLVSLAKAFKTENGDETYDLAAHFGVLMLPVKQPLEPEFLLAEGVAACEAAIYHEQPFAYFSQQFQDSLVERHNLELALSKAIDHNLEGFELFHQPQFNAQQQVVGGEVLLRWRLHGEFVSPDRFIPIAEKSEDIIRINRWVINHVTEHLLELDRLGLLEDYANLSINLSAKCVMDKGLIPFVQQKIQAIPWLVEHVTFELTETAFIQDINQVKEQIAQLKTMGFKVSIDDFGTGYSSLSYLSEFSFDELKIDKRFIEQIGSEHPKPYRLVKSILGIADALDVEVVAEGVETAEQLAILTEMNCKHFQGFFFQKPMPFKALVKRLGHHG